MPLVNPASSDQNINELAFAIREEKSNQYHTGILYKVGSNPTRISHLLWHLIFRDARAGGRFCWVDVQLPALSKFSVISNCLRIANANQNGQIPYSIFYARKKYFDPSSGVYNNRVIGFGLTCSTFILAVFEIMEIRLIKEETWKWRWRDLWWQAKMIFSMYRKGADKKHLWELVRQIGCLRYKPEEVVASGPVTKKPVSFEEMFQHSQNMLASLHQIQPKLPTFWGRIWA